jgi:hypothetical protein
MILETVLFDRYVCQISCFSPQVKYLGEFFMLAATLWMVLSLVCSTCLSNKKITQIKKNKKNQTWTMHTCYIFWTFHYSIYSSHCTWCNHREIQFYHNNGDFVWQFPLSYVFCKQEVHIINRIFHMAYSLYIPCLKHRRQCLLDYTDQCLGARVMVFNPTFNDIECISWRSILLVEETGVNHRPAASHWQTLSHNVVSSTPRPSVVGTHNVSGDRHLLHREL